MYDIRQFRPTFYLVMILAFAGYGIALESLPHLVGGILLIGIHALMALRKSTFLMPRPVASILAVLTGGWSLIGLARGTVSPLLAISQWLFMLVLITLYSRRENRAHGQMLVMSLVLMVAGAINTASLLFGVILIAYLSLSLYCCLLFHLKVETEYAIRAYNLTDNRPLPASLRHDQRNFSRSMRRLVTLVSVVATTAGVLVFVFFPRSHIAPSLSMAGMGKQSAPLTGFSERMGFEQVAKITQNEDVVAHVALTRNGKALPASDIYLRGMTLDIYTGRSYRSRQLDWQWVRSAEANDSSELYRLSPGVWQPLAAIAPENQIHQTILLQPTGTSTLFAMNGVTSIAADAGIDLQHFPGDGTLRTSEPLHGALRYEAISTGEPPPFQAARPAAPYPAAQGIPYWARQFASPPLTASRIDARVAEYAARPDVSGSDASGPFATQRDKHASIPTALDEKIASAISHHLQSNFQYTLDLSDVARTPLQDPMAQFLYDFKRGHCEYFAGAMTLMCQSLGLKARVVIGFHAGAGDFNRLGGYYVIRQSHAHAWVEVLTQQGWKSFDPTTGDTYIPPPSRGVLATFADIFDYLQYKWASSVVSYDNQNISILGNVESGFSASVERGGNVLDTIKEFLHSEQAFHLSARILAAAIFASVGVALLAVAVLVAKRRRLNRRAQRIGLGALPSQDRLRLARQLRFYDDLLQLLARQRIGRPAYLTPREFASSLGFLPSEIYTKVGQVTEVFYRVRYGDEPLTTHEHREISAIIADIAAGLTPHRRA